MYEEKTAHRVSKREYKWAGDDMNYKCMEWVRVAELCVDSNITRVDADLFATKTARTMKELKIEVLALAETAIGNVSGAYKTIKEVMEQEGYRTCIASNNLHKYAKGTGTMIIVSNEQGKITNVEEAEEGRALAITIQSPRSEKADGTIKVIAIYAPSEGAAASRVASVARKM